MKKKTHIFAIVILVVLSVLAYFHFRSSNSEVPSVNPEDMGSSVSEDVEGGKPAVTYTPPPPVAVGSAGGFLPTEMEDPDKFVAIQKALQEMGTCFGVSIAALEPNTEFNLQTLGSLISPLTGEPIMTTNEWTTTDIQTAGGELRRIFLQYNTDIMSDTASSLKYYSISENGEQKEISLTPEQMNDPSDTLVASLEADGSVIGNSRSQRLFFQNGSNLLMVERNGKLYSFDLPYQQKRYRCEGLDSSKTLKCHCQ